MSVTHSEARNVSSRPCTLLLSLVAVSGLWFAGCRTAPRQSHESPSEPVIVALRDAAIINLTDGSVTPHQTVVIEGDRIKVVGSVTKVRVPARAQIVEARGRFLIPGLWDMHVHSVDEDPSEGYRPFFPIFVANGITGVRDMWGTQSSPPLFADASRKAICSGPVSSLQAISLTAAHLSGPVPPS